MRGRNDAAARRTAAFYRAIWRWHFYAGLSCLPFVIWLSLTGAIYLWRPRGQRGWVGALFPRWRARGRRFWRDLHGAVGIWASVFALALVLAIVLLALYLPLFGLSLAAVLTLEHVVFRRITAVRHCWDCSRLPGKSRPVCPVVRARNRVAAGKAEKGCRLTDGATIETIKQK